MVVVEIRVIGPSQSALNPAGVVRRRDSFYIALFNTSIALYHLIYNRLRCVHGGTTVSAIPEDARVPIRRLTAHLQKR
jgi:hypothetical protein